MQVPYVFFQRDPDAGTVSFLRRDPDAGTVRFLRRDPDTGAAHASVL